MSRQNILRLWITQTKLLNQKNSLKEVQFLKPSKVNVATKLMIFAWLDSSKMSSNEVKPSPQNMMMNGFWFSLVRCAGPNLKKVTKKYKSAKICVRHRANKKLRVYYTVSNDAG